MRRFLPYALLGALALGVTALAVNLVIQPSPIWFKQRVYIGSNAQAPAASTAHGISSTRGASAWVNVGVIDAGTCRNEAVTIAGAAAGDPCMVAPPADTQSQVRYSCFINGSGTGALVACADTSNNADPDGGTFYFRTFSNQ
jgi:hypothetical protein